jgi:uncharacterized protein YybS (DUF2232 family)
MKSTEGNVQSSGYATAGKELFFQIVLTVSLFLSVSFIPLAGFLTGILTPAPTVISMTRWGQRPTAWLFPVGSCVAGTLALLGLGLGLSVPYFLALVAMGTVMGHGMRQEWPTGKVVGLSGLVVVAIVGMLLAFAYVETHGEMVRLLEQDLQNAISGTLKQLGSPSTETQAVESALLAAVPVIVRTIPGILVASALGIGWINMLVARRYCRAMALQWCLREDLKLWKAPEFLVWFVIAGGFMLLLPWGGLSIYGLNLLIVLGTVFFLQGLAIVSFYFDKWKMPLLARSLIYAVLFLQQFASMLTAVVGLFDIWFDFRKLVKKPA